MFDKIKRLISHVLIYGFGNLGTRLVGFILIPVYSRYLLPEDYGVLALIAMFGQLLYTAINLGQNSALTRTYLLHDDPVGRDTVITTSLWLNLGLCLPIGLVVLGLSQPIASLLTGSPTYVTWVAIGTLGIMFKALLRLPLSVLRAREQSRRYAISSVVQTTIALVLAIAFVVGLHLGGRGILLSQLLAEVILCAFLLPMTLKGLSLKFSRDDARDLLGYGLAITPMPVLSFLLHLADRYILKHFLSVAAVGIYALGYRFGEILSFVIIAFELGYTPFLLAHLKSPGAHKLYARISTYYVAVMGLSWLVVSLLADETVKLMTPPAFHDAAPVIPWIAGAFLFQGVGFVCAQGLGIHKLVRYRLMISVIAVISNLGLNLALIPRYGVMGAAVAALLSLAIQCTLQVVIGYRVFPIPYEYGRLARLIIIGIGIYAVGTVINWGSITAALVAKGCLLLTAPALLYVSGFFTAEERSRLRDVGSLFRKGPAALLPARGVDE